jgi:hypothetical protein
MASSESESNNFYSKVWIIAKRIVQMKTWVIKYVVKDLDFFS